MNTGLVSLFLTLGAVLSGGGLVSFLVWLLIFALVVYCIFLVLGMLPLPATVKTIATIIVAIVLLIVLLNHLGIAI